MLSKLVSVSAALLAATLVLPAMAQEDAPVDDDGLPTYKVVDGKVDRGTYNGYRRYHNSCHVCHGPDGLGGSFAPDLTESLTRLSYTDFAEVVVNGRQVEGAAGNRVMPSFGLDPNVMNHMDDIYRYLKARSDEALGRGRPARIPKQQAEATGQ